MPGADAQHRAPARVTTSPRRSSAAGSCAAQGADEPEITIACAWLEVAGVEVGDDLDAAARGDLEAALQARAPAREGRPKALGCSVSTWTIVPVATPRAYEPAAA